MSPRELGRQAALLHLKMAQATTSSTPSSSLSTAAAGTKPSNPGGAATAGNFGAKPMTSNVAAAPAVPDVTPQPAAAPGTLGKPTPATARPTAPAGSPAPPAGGIGSMLGGAVSGAMTPQFLGQMAAGPLSGMTKGVLGSTGMAGLAGLSNLALHGGSQMRSLGAGEIGGVKPGVT